MDEFRTVVSLFYLSFSTFQKKDGYLIPFIYMKNNLSGDTIHGKTHWCYNIDNMYQRYLFKKTNYNVDFNVNNHVERNLN